MDIIQNMKMNNFDFNDDMMSDRLDYLADIHADFWEWLEVLWTVPELPEGWEIGDEPSDAELAVMNANADLLVADILGDER